MALLDERLSKYGFVWKKKYNYFVRTIDDNIILNIGFVCATHNEITSLYISPTFGVIYRDVLKVESKLIGLEKSIYPDYVGAMITSVIGHLMPVKCYMEWRFTIDQDVTEEVNKMADTIIKYGLPYLDELSDRDGVIYGLEIGKYTGRPEFLLPIFYHLNGNNKRALECMDEFIEKFSENRSKEEDEILRILAGGNEEIHIESSSLKYYLEFVENFNRYCSEHINGTYAPK